MSELAAEAAMDLEAGPADRVIADYLRRLDRGEVVSRDDLIDAHPECAEELRAYFDDLDEVEQFAGLTQEWGGLWTPPPSCPRSRCPHNWPTTR